MRHRSLISLPPLFPKEMEKGFGIPSSNLYLRDVTRAMEKKVHKLDEETSVVDEILGFGPV
jgi:hypothetical protein